MRAVLLIVLLASCGDDLHHPNAMPQVTYHGGTVLHRVDVATVTYANDPLAPKFQAFDQFVLGSQWLATVGEPYDLRGGTYLGAYTVAHEAPATMTSSDLLQDLVATVPLQPDAPADPPLFLIRIPHGTTYQGGPGAACSDWSAYHGSTYDGYPYAVMLDCAGTDRVTGGSTAHELIEAATNPTGFGWYAGDSANLDDPWRGEPGEVADLCGAVRPLIDEGGYSMPRVWSVVAAEAARPDPCVPVLPGEVWVDVDVDPSQPIHLGRGESADITLTGWSTGPTADWPLQIDVPTWSVKPTITLSSPTINDGQRVTMHVTMPADAGPIAGLIEIGSRDALALVALNPVPGSLPLDERGTDPPWRRPNTRSTSAPTSCSRCRRRPRR